MDRFSKTIEWLLEEEDPGVRHLVLRDLEHLDINDAQLVDVRIAAHRHGAIATVLDAMHPDGYWVEPGPGYSPKYRSTVWAVIMLAQMGASLDEDERIQRSCMYLLENSLTRFGQFTMSGAPSGTIACLQGNLCWALISLGCMDERLKKAYDWLSRSITGEGVASSTDKNSPLRYYASICGPNFECGANYKLPFAWGALKELFALSVCPQGWQTSISRKAIQLGVDFLFSIDPVTAGYPSGGTGKPSQSWWKLGFPVFYVSDVLQVLEVLSALGYNNDPRLKNLVDFILKKMDTEGRWKMEYDLSGKTWVDFGPLKQPNKWVTLRALRALEQNRTLLEG